MNYYVLERWQIRSAYDMKLSLWGWGNAPEGKLIWARAGRFRRRRIVPALGDVVGLSRHHDACESWHGASIARERGFVNNRWLSPVLPGDSFVAFRSHLPVPR